MCSSWSFSKDCGSLGRISIFEIVLVKFVLDLSVECSTPSFVTIYELFWIGSLIDLLVSFITLFMRCLCFSFTDPGVIWMALEYCSC